MCQRMMFCVDDAKRITESIVSILGGVRNIRFIFQSVLLTVTLYTQPETSSM